MTVIRTLMRPYLACRTLSHAQQLVKGISNTRTIALDVNDTKALDDAMAACDVVISLIPYTFHAAVIKSAVKGRTNVVTTSYVSPAMLELENEVKEAGITVMNEIGLDPGIDRACNPCIGHGLSTKCLQIYMQSRPSMRSISKEERSHHSCHIVEVFRHQSKRGSMQGHICAKYERSSDNPLGYKFSWSSRGVLLALRNTAKFYQDGKVSEIPGPELMGSAKRAFVPSAVIEGC